MIVEYPFLHLETIRVSIEGLIVFDIIRFPVYGHFSALAIVRETSQVDLPF
jgi:hypothetical protein